LHFLVISPSDVACVSVFIGALVGEFGLEEVELLREVGVLLEDVLLLSIHPGNVGSLFIELCLVLVHDLLVRLNQRGGG
jgi:hypothetical protein